MSLDIFLYDVEQCPHCSKDIKSNVVVWRGNITHNVNKIAKAAGIYEIVWRPDEHGIRLASELVDRLEKGLAVLKKDPSKFTPLNPENGWGSYDSFVAWIEEYLQACKDNPEAIVKVSR